MSKHKKKRRSDRPSAANTTVRPQFRELGSTGLKRAGGIVLEEFNSKLQGATWIETCDRMLRGDGQVQAVELAICLPIEGLNWWIDPGGSTATDIEIAELLNDNLFDGMSCTFEDVISEAMMGPFLGVSLLEEVWESRNGMTWLRKLAPRHPRTIKEWLFDESGGVQGIKQRLENNPDRSEVEIPIDKLLRFTWRSQTSPEGRALMRPMYKHWWIKDALYKIANIGFERFWMPTPIGQLPQGYTADDEAAYKSALEAIRAAQGGGMMMPPGYPLPTLLESNLKVPEMMAYINHHDLMISRSGLAQFLNLGSSNVGSWALSDSQVRFFILSLAKMTRWIKSIFQRYLIPQWIGYNYPGYNVYPTMECTPVMRLVQPGAFAEALHKLSTGKLITTPDQDIEATVREVYELPERAEDKDSQSDGGTDPTDDSDVAASRRWGRTRKTRSNPKANLSAASTSRTRQRPRDHAHWEETEERLTAAKDDFQQVMQEVVKEQHKQLVAKLEPMVKAYLAADPLNKGSWLKKMREVRVPLIARYASTITDFSRKFYLEAMAVAAEAAGIAAPTTIPNAMRTWMTSLGEEIAEDHANKLGGAVRREAMEVCRRDIDLKTTVWNMKQVAAKRSSGDLSADLRTLGLSLVDSIESAFDDLPTETE